MTPAQFVTEDTSNVYRTKNKLIRHCTRTSVIIKSEEIVCLFIAIIFPCGHLLWNLLRVNTLGWYCSAMIIASSWTVLVPQLWLYILRTQTASTLTQITNSVHNWDSIQIVLLTIISYPHLNTNLMPPYLSDILQGQVTCVMAPKGNSVDDLIGGHNLYNKLWWYSCSLACQGSA